MRKNSSMNHLFLLVKEESIQVLNNNNQEWKPEQNNSHPLPYGLPLVHHLPDELFTPNPSQITTKEFRKLCHNGLLKRNAFIAIPDDYSELECHTIQNFVHLHGNTKMIYLVPYSTCISAREETGSYIAVTAARRCISLKKYIRGNLLNTEYIQWQDAEKQLKKSIQNWESLPVYICDPNHMLDAYQDAAWEMVEITEELFIRITEKAKL